MNHFVYFADSYHYKYLFNNCNRYFIHNKNGTYVFDHQISVVDHQIFFLYLFFVLIFFYTKKKVGDRLRLFGDRLHLTQ
jgi:hypothetical protein